jgi:hypothetical protein
MLTGDLNIIDVEWVVQYRIADPIKFLYACASPTHAARPVRIGHAPRRRQPDRQRGADHGRVEIANTARDEIQDAMDRYDNGIHIITVELQDVVPPPRVQPAFNEVNEARQERERMINEATKQANQAIPRAEGEANRAISEAEGLCDRARQPRARRDGALQRGAGRVPQCAGGHPLAPVPRDAASRCCRGRLGGRGAGRPGAAAAAAEPARCAARERAGGRQAMNRNIPDAPSLGALLARSSLRTPAFIIDQAEQGIIVQFGEPIGDVIDRAGAALARAVHPGSAALRQAPAGLGRRRQPDPDARPRVHRRRHDGALADRDPLQFLRSVRDESGARTRLDDIIDSVARDIVSGTDSRRSCARPTGRWTSPVSPRRKACARRERPGRPKKGRAQLEREMLAAPRG